MGGGVSMELMGDIAGYVVWCEVVFGVQELIWLNGKGGAVGMVWVLVCHGEIWFVAVVGNDLM